MTNKNQRPDHEKTTRRMRKPSRKIYAHSYSVDDDDDDDWLVQMNPSDHTIQENTTDAGDTK